MSQLSYCLQYLKKGRYGCWFRCFALLCPIVIVSFVSRIVYLELQIVVSFRRPLILRVEELAVLGVGFIFMLLLMLFNIFLLAAGLIFSSPSLLSLYLREYLVLSLCLIFLR